MKKQELFLIPFFNHRITKTTFLFMGSYTLGLIITLSLGKNFEPL